MRLNNNGKRLIIKEFILGNKKFHVDSIIQFYLNEAQNLYIKDVDVPHYINLDIIFCDYTIDIPERVNKMNDTVIHNGCLYKFVSYTNELTAVLQHISSKKRISVGIKYIVQPTKYYFINSRGTVQDDFKERDEQRYEFTGKIGLRFDTKEEAVAKLKEI